MTQCPSRDLRTLLTVACLGLAIAAPHSGRAADVTLTETGSTLLQPLFAIWVADYTKTHPGVTITIAGTGSEAGITQAPPARCRSARPTPICRMPRSGRPPTS